MYRFLPLSTLLIALAGPLATLPALAQDTRTVAGPEKKAYMIQAQAKVIENWQPPDVDADVRLSVYFRIDRDGKVKDKIDVKTLGDGKADTAEQAAVEAIRRAQPFPPVPANVDPYYVDVKFTLRLSAKTPPTPACLPIATFIALPTEKQAPVQAGLKKWTEIVKDRGANVEAFKVVDSRENADLIIEGSTESTLPRADKVGFVGDYKVNAALTTGTIRLGLKDKAGADLSSEQLTNNTLQLLGRSFGLPGTSLADTVMSSARFTPALLPEEGRIVADLAKAATCPADKAKRGFVVRDSAPPAQ